MAELNLFKIAQARLDGAAQRLGLDAATHEFLRWPQLELKVTLPVEMDDGAIQIFHGYRVQYNGARGPTKGGCAGIPRDDGHGSGVGRMDDLEDGGRRYPPGGGKGGITCDPKIMSEREKERLARAYMRAVARILAVSRDVPAPDVYTNPQIMAWMMDEYEALTGEHHPGVITGKPIPLAGPREEGTPRPAEGFTCSGKRRRNWRWICRGRPWPFRGSAMSVNLPPCWVTKFWGSSW